MNEKEHIFYIGSAALGEMLAQTPVIKRLRESYFVTLVAPRNLEYILGDQAVADNFLSYETASFRNNGGRCFHALLPEKPGPLWTSCHFDVRDGSAEHAIKATRLVENETEGLYLETYMRAIYGSREYLGDYKMHTSYIPPRRTNAVVVCDGSYEKIRSFSTDTTMRIVTPLMKDLPIKLISDVLLPRNDMKRMAQMVAGCDLLISPDTGPMWLALALGKKVICLPTREDVIVPPIYEKQITIIRKQEPRCDRACRAMSRFSSTPENLENYPKKLACWGSHPPCLALEEDEIRHLIFLATSLTASHGNTVPVFSIPPSVES
jgi:hypothetical protein